MAQVRGSFFKALGIVNGEFDRLTVCLTSELIENAYQERLRELEILQKEGMLDEKQCPQLQAFYDTAYPVIRKKGEEIKWKQDGWNRILIENAIVFVSNKNEQENELAQAGKYDFSDCAPICNFIAIIEAFGVYLKHTLPLESARKRIGDVKPVGLEALQEIITILENENNPNKLTLYLSFTKELQILYEMAEKCRINSNEIEGLKKQNNKIQKLVMDLTRNKALKRQFSFLKNNQEKAAQASMKQAKKQIRKTFDSFAKAQENFVKQLEIHHEECKAEEIRERTLEEARKKYLIKIEEELNQAKDDLEREIAVIAQDVPFLQYRAAINTVLDFRKDSGQLDEPLEEYNKRLQEAKIMLDNADKFFLKTAEIKQKINHLNSQFQELKYGIGTSSSYILALEKYEILTNLITEWGSNKNSSTPTGIKKLKEVIDEFKPSKPPANSSLVASDSFVKQQLRDLQDQMKKLSAVAQDRLSCFTRFRMNIFCHRAKETTDLYVLLRNIQKATLKDVSKQAQHIRQQLLGKNGEKFSIPPVASSLVPSHNSIN